MSYSRRWEIPAQSDDENDGRGGQKLSESRMPTNVDTIIMRRQAEYQEYLVQEKRASLLFPASNRKPKKTVEAGMFYEKVNYTERCSSYPESVWNLFTSSYFVCLRFLKPTVSIVRLFFR